MKKNALTFALALLAAIGFVACNDNPAAPSAPEPTPTPTPSAAASVAPNAPTGNTVCMPSDIDRGEPIINLDGLQAQFQFRNLGKNVCPEAHASSYVDGSKPPAEQDLHDTSKKVSLKPGDQATETVDLACGVMNQVDIHLGPPPAKGGGFNGGNFVKVGYIMGAPCASPNPKPKPSPEPGECKLCIRVKVDKDKIPLGEVLNYTMEFQSIGPGPCTGEGVHVANRLVSGLEWTGLEQHSPNGEFGYNGQMYSDRTLHWNFDVLTPGESGWVKFQAKPSRAGTYSNHGSITAAEVNWRWWNSEEVVTVVVDRE